MIAVTDLLILLLVAGVFLLLPVLWIVLKFRYLESRMLVLEDRLSTLPAQVATCAAEIHGVHDMLRQVQAQVNTLTQIHMRDKANG